MSTRENIRLIARASLTLICSRIKNPRYFASETKLKRCSNVIYFSCTTVTKVLAEEAKEANS